MAGGSGASSGSAGAFGDGLRFQPNERRLRVLVLVGSGARGFADRWLTGSVVRSPTPASAVHVTSVENVVGFVAKPASVSRWSTVRTIAISADSSRSRLLEWRRYRKRHGGDGSRGLMRAGLRIPPRPTPPMTRPPRKPWRPRSSPGRQRTAPSTTWPMRDRHRLLRRRGEASEARRAPTLDGGASTRPMDRGAATLPRTDRAATLRTEGRKRAHHAGSSMRRVSTTQRSTPASGRCSGRTTAFAAIRTNRSIRWTRAGYGIVLSGNNAGLDHDAYPPNLTNDPTGSMLDESADRERDSERDRQYGRRSLPADASGVRRAAVWARRWTPDGPRDHRIFCEACPNRQHRAADELLARGCRRLIDAAATKFVARTVARPDLELNSRRAYCSRRNRVEQRGIEHRATSVPSVADRSEKAASEAPEDDAKQREVSAWDSPASDAVEAASPRSPGGGRDGRSV